jgi:hypothetical protein
MYGIESSRGLKRATLFESLFQSIDQHFGSLKNISPLNQWVKGITLDGKPFSFAGGHEYLEEIYKDTSTDITLEKAAQMGVSVWAILDSLHGMRFGRYPFGVLYLFPSRIFVTEFSKTKLQNIIDENDFGDWFTDTDAANVKRIGKSSLFLRGMHSRTGLKSLSVNKLCLDEVEEIENMLLIDLAMERLSHIENPVVHRLSVPSAPQYGIDSFFQNTDQRYWLLKCQVCGESTCLEDTFPDCLLEVDGRVIRACSKCKGELNPSLGEWVAKKPSDKRGYHISQLFSKFISPASLLQTYLTGKNLTTFYNDKLGIPYVEAANRLSVQEVLSLCGNEGIAESDAGPCYCGIDQGGLLHVTIAKKHSEKAAKIVYIGVLKGFEEVDTLMKKFNIIRVVIDAMPEVRKARELAGRYPGKVFLSYYNDHQRGSYRWDEKRMVVSSNRTESMDASHNEVLNQSIILPRESDLIRTFADHCHNTAKRLETDEETGSQRYTYIRLGDDHFRHSLNYCVMAYQSCPTFLFPELL